MPTSGRAELGELEGAVMSRLWDMPTGGTLSVRDVFESLSRERELAYTTVMTVLDRLAKKGMADRVRDGRAWRYAAAATREQMTARALHQTLADLDGGERQAAFAHFLGDASHADLAALRAELDRIESDASQDDRRP
ncbi:BlaI/MecI/CopY family transcriptional regulator [Allobranchiibius sp. CTAmp26]|uniref:BlaI/MecI/CopY family transcriptional regulator n=1 Tax=Allobranchiibius sp. CTAmp26 TaxID=2815214 RepID=UPI001AA0CE96|nr:BlaI/MecI/CopY family transcriptional regulator [Allobranchiibius sp. CTAmp26]MBO1754844.1 BlaI/MecI/CopY family transcriptional regulator [Allobranchiibius sp. CTAmp26]